MKFSVHCGLAAVPKGAGITKRQAVRGIIADQGKLLMVTNVCRDYKFPGGGVHEQEDERLALLREIKEETGYTDLEILGLAGEAEQINVDLHNQFGYFVMHSSYYLCRLNSREQVLPRLDAYEDQLDFKPVFITAAEALEINQHLLLNADYQNHWLLRETKVLAILSKEKNLMNML
ncbi:hypothetical protein SDC9_103871 [bioreactor metagenome]|uniref:Nudix hydrolase domain-containing protein n=1 Tax=bioreactor metagenome TaxID=1076179 RepID=A0A645B1L3_9ZZZZ